MEISSFLVGMGRIFVQPNNKIEWLGNFSEHCQRKCLFTKLQCGYNLLFNVGSCGKQDQTKQKDGPQSFGSHKKQTTQDKTKRKDSGKKKAADKVHDPQISESSAKETSQLTKKRKTSREKGKRLGEGCSSSCISREHYWQHIF